MERVEALPPATLGPKEFSEATTNVIGGGIQGAEPPFSIDRCPVHSSSTTDWS